MEADNDRVREESGGEGHLENEINSENYFLCEVMVLLLKLFK
jgi:hypothetical protein